MRLEATAIANALFDATGVRLLQYPMTPERVGVTLASKT
jgi:CO/xanthine dehydrogenase Mo-binding subunit